MRPIVCALATAAALSSAVRPVHAGAKEECLAAHVRGQAERDDGHLTKARDTFASCARASCPGIVQADCERLREEMTKMIPTVTFAARDANGATLPATSVFVDDVLVTKRLDDGKVYDVDPGPHVVRYVHGESATSIRFVLAQGEKRRVLAASFAPLAKRSEGSPEPEPDAEPEPEADTTRSVLPLAVAGTGALGVITGAVVAGIGIARVPSHCSWSTNECSAEPGDPAIAQAQSGVSITNTGLGIAIGGAAMLVGGIVWYVLQPAARSGSAKTTSPHVFTF